jgi:hypothetical protein
MEPENAFQDGGSSPPTVHNVNQSEVHANTGLAEPSPNIPQELKPSRYHCSPEWHLSRLVHAPFAGVLYSFARRISKNSGSFHGSVLGIAEYFDVSRWKVQRAIKALVDSGFFVCIAQEIFQPSVYRVISHTDWAAKHPGRCAVKEIFPWSEEEGDKLRVSLWNASGGKVKYQPYQLLALRKTGKTDDEIVAAFVTFVAAEQARRKAGGWTGRWGAVQRGFSRWLTGQAQAAELEMLGLQPYSSGAH